MSDVDVGMLHQKLDAALHRLEALEREMLALKAQISFGKAIFGAALPTASLIVAIVAVSTR